MKPILFAALLFSGCASSGALKLTVQCAGLPVLTAADVAERIIDVEVPLENADEKAYNVDSMRCHIEMYKAQ